MKSNAKQERADRTHLRDCPKRGTWEPCPACNEARERLKVTWCATCHTNHPAPRDEEHRAELGCTGHIAHAPVTGGAAEDAYQFGRTLRDPEWERVACYDRPRRRAIWARYRADEVALRCGREGDDGLVTLRLGATVDADMLRRLREFFEQASMATIDDEPAMVEMPEAAAPEDEP